MSGESPKARRYERLYPDTGIPENQKEERMDRMDLKSGRRSSVLIPDLPPSMQRKEDS